MVKYKMVKLLVTKFTYNDWIISKVTNTHMWSAWQTPLNQDLFNPHINCVIVVSVCQTAVMNPYHGIICMPIPFIDVGVSLSFFFNPS